MEFLTLWDKLYSLPTRFAKQKNLPVTVTGAPLYLFVSLTPPYRVELIDIRQKEKERMIFFSNL